MSEEELNEKKIPELEYNVQRYEYVPKGMVEGVFGAWGLAVIGGWLNFPLKEVGERMLGVREFLGRG